MSSDINYDLHELHDVEDIFKLDDDTFQRWLKRSVNNSERKRRTVEAPEFTQRLTSFLEALVGETIVFKGQFTPADSISPISVKWYKNDEELRSSDRMKFDVDGGDEGRIIRLTINHLVRSDEGAYKCKIENKDGIASTTGYLSVTDQKKNKSSKKIADRRSFSPLLGAITEQRSVEEREAESQLMQPASPIQYFIDTIRHSTRTITSPIIYCDLEKNNQESYELIDSNIDSTELNRSIDIYNTSDKELSQNIISNSAYKERNNKKEKNYNLYLNSIQMMIEKENYCRDVHINKQDFDSISLLQNENKEIKQKALKQLLLNQNDNYNYGETNKENSFISNSTNLNNLIIGSKNSDFIYDNSDNQKSNNTDSEKQLKKPEIFLYLDDQITYINSLSELIKNESIENINTLSDILLNKKDYNKNDYKKDLYSNLYFESTIYNFILLCSIVTFVSLYLECNLLYILIYIFIISLLYFSPVSNASFWKGHYHELSSIFLDCNFYPYEI